MHNPCILIAQQINYLFCSTEALTSTVQIPCWTQPWKRTFLAFWLVLKSISKDSPIKMVVNYLTPLIWDLEQLEIATLHTVYRNIVIELKCACHRALPVLLTGKIKGFSHYRKIKCLYMCCKLKFQYFMSTSLKRLKYCSVQTPTVIYHAILHMCTRLRVQEIRIFRQHLACEHIHNLK